MLDRSSQQSFHSLAEYHSATAFLNSLFREWPKAPVTDSPDEILEKDKCNNCVMIELETDETICIPIKKVSRVGCHRYGRRFYVRKSGKLETIDFNTLVDLIIDYLSKDYQTSSNQTRIFKYRVKNSQENISKFLARRSHDLGALFNAQVGTQEPSIDFIQAEQSLLLGHSFHPTPKSREDFNEGDLEQYSPEMKAQFELCWILVHRDILYEKQSFQFEGVDWLNHLFRNEGLNLLLPNQEFTESYTPFPVHPWQRNAILKNPDVQVYLRDKKVINLGKASRYWCPTSSLRSLYCKQEIYMLKFSLSLRMTNSVRHLLDSEVTRGIQLQDVMSTPHAKDFIKEYPQFYIIFEPAFAAIKDSHGNIISSSIVVCRDNPFYGENGQEKILLATLTQDNPYGGNSLVLEFIRRYAQSYSCELNEACRVWFEKYLDLVVTPLMMAQAKYGILLGAHQQNLVISIQNGLPQATYFRDCQGTGYSQRGYSLYASTVSALNKENGNILREEKGNVLFSYYVVINSTFNVIASISKESWISETELLDLFKGHLVRLKTSLSSFHDASCFDYLLSSNELMQKGNFLCSFKNVNENAAPNPIDIYNRIQNPLLVGSHESGV